MNTIPLRRSSERVLGGVCAGIGESFGVDPVLVRLAAVVIGLFSAGFALVAYVVAWVLIPPAGTEPAAPRPVATPPAAAVSSREAWYAVGDELQALVGGLRRPSPESPVRDRPRSPLEAVDRAATEAGDRLRTPEVRESARRLATGLSTAVTTGVDELGRKVRGSG